MIDLAKKPFNLTKEEIGWVEDTKKSMSIEEKIGQLFFLVGIDPREEALRESLSIKPGGIMFRPMPKGEITAAHKFLQGNSKIPLFLAANIEAGADGLIVGGTHAGNNMQIAATNDSDLAYRQGEVAIKEALTVGGNMAFAPVIDINYNFENPITNTRSYGDNPQKVAEFSKKFVDGVQEFGGSVTIKHFPGDGADGRDQHLLASKNNLGLSDWKKTYGYVYKENINNGATGMMVGHISLPSYFEENNITSEPSNIPASLSAVLLNDLVRSELGFNGLIMTDASPMAGFGQYGKRENLVPECIAAGNDMILFTRNIEEDFNFMMQGYIDGVLTEDRLDDAITRILGLKAAQKFYDENQLFKTFETEGINNIKHEVPDNAITLVKDEANILPIKNCNKKIGIIKYGINDDKYAHFVNKLKEEGFTISELDFSVGMDQPFEMVRLMKMSIKELKQEADLIIYLSACKPASNQSTLRVGFSGAGLDAPWFINEVDTMYISLGNPYQCYDLEPVKTGINTYDDTNETIDALVEKIMGRSEFKGVSPVNLECIPFNGDISKWN